MTEFSFLGELTLS